MKNYRVRPSSRLIGEQPDLLRAMLSIPRHLFQTSRRGNCRFYSEFPRVRADIFGIPLFNFERVKLLLMLSRQSGSAARVETGTSRPKLRPTTQIRRLSATMLPHSRRRDFSGHWLPHFKSTHTEKPSIRAHGLLIE